MINIDTQEKTKIIIIEDDPDILWITEYHLRKNNYIVESAQTGANALNFIRQAKADLLLLDLMIPGVDGLAICKHIKQNKSLDLPVIIISAKTNEADIVAGLELGADDYLKKPFGPKELIARIDAVLRRNIKKAMEVKLDVIILGDITIDTIKHQVLLYDKTIPLTNSEFNILTIMAQSPGQVFSRSQLLQSTGNKVVIDRNIDVHIRSLRIKLGDKYKHLINTVHGLGYRLQEI